MSVEKQEGIHQGHRNRIREQFFSKGFDLFDDITLLEMVLFYCVPRKNTNDLAHRLIDHFGSLNSVLRADTDELSSLGLSEKGALLLSLIHDVMMTEYSPRKKIVVSEQTLDSIGSFFLNRYIGDDSDETCILLLDSNCKDLYCKTLKPDTITDSSEAKDVVNLALMYNASGAVIAHNKPGCDPIPDYADIQAAKILSSVLGKAHLYLIDYLIIADNIFFSIGSSEYCSLII